MSDPQNLRSYRPGNRPCPHSGHGLIRVRRSAAERELRDIGTGAPLHRYRCSDPVCGWQGLLPQPAAGASGRREGGDRTAGAERRGGGSRGRRRSSRPAQSRLAAAWRALRPAALAWPQVACLVGAVALLALAGVQGSRWLQGGDTVSTVRAGNGR